MKGIVEQLGRWAWIMAILGFGHRWLNHDGRMLSYLSTAAFPFYLLHLLSVTWVGSLIIQLPLGLAGKYFIIVILSTVVTFLGYEFIRRIPGMSFLCGIKPRNR